MHGPLVKLLISPKGMTKPKDLKKKYINKISEKLMVDELKKAEIQIVHQTQCSEFQDAWTVLVRVRPCYLAASYLSWSQNWIVTDCDGRLKNAKFLSYDVRHPVILAHRSCITKLNGKPDFWDKPDLSDVICSVLDYLGTRGDSGMAEGVYRVSTTKNQSLQTNHALHISDGIKSLHQWTSSPHL